MTLNVGRVAVLMLVIAGVTGAVVLMPAWMPKHSEIAAKPTTWLPMPPDGMDARQKQIRQLLAHNDPPFSDGSVLALRCGIDSSDGDPNEHYSIRIGDGALVRNAQRWSVDFIPSGDNIDVTIHIVAPYPPPPPPEPGKTASSPIDIHDRSAYYHMDRNDLQPIHDALANSELWLAAQGEEPFGCYDGRSVTIEACVRGQYIARLRNCDAASGEPAQKLWDLLRQRFPQPMVGNSK